MSLDSSMEQSSSRRLPEIGSLVAERYRILELVGRGGMGAVYRAEHVQLQRNVAVKMLLGDFTSDSGVFKRFQQEARIASQLDHPNIVNVHDFGMIGEAQAYLTMDYIAGRSLDDDLKTGFTLTIERFRHIFLQAFEALEHAHQAGVVHRDIKPSNLMLVKRGKDPDFLKIVDFGLVKLMSAGGEEQKLTSSNTLVGSPLYMSPEQCRGLELDHRSDIYSLGCVMYRALSGTLAVSGETPLDTLFKHVSELPLPISQVNPKAGVSPELDALILKALAKSPDDRQQSMAQLREELLVALPGPVDTISQSSSSFIAPTPPLPAPPQMVPVMIAARPRKQSKPSMWLWLGPTLGLGLIGAVIIGSLWFVLNNERKQHELEVARIQQQAAQHARLQPVVKAPAPQVAQVQPKPKPVAAVPVEKPKPPAQKVEKRSGPDRQKWITEANLLQKEGDQALLEMDRTSARQAYERCLELEDVLYGKGSPQLLPILGRLVVSCHGLGDDHAAMTYFTRFTSLYTLDPSPVAHQVEGRRTIVSAALDIARASAQRGNTQVADTYFRWAIEIGKDIPGTAMMAQQQYQKFKQISMGDSGGPIGGQLGGGNNNRFPQRMRNRFRPFAQ